MSERAEAIRLASLAGIRDHEWLEDQYEAIERLVQLAREDAYEKAAKACDYLTGRSQEFDMGRLHCAQGIRAMKYRAPTNETGIDKEERWIT